ncbi:hypothetical protein GC174_02100 [bacterium]|nr:hypothetical protein [bacterium]
MAENQLETPKAPVAEVSGDADLKMSHQAGELLREQAAQSKESPAAGNELDGKFGTPMIDFGENGALDVGSKISDKSEPEGSGEKFIDQGISMQRTEQFEASDTNAIAGYSMSQQIDIDPVQEGLGLANEHFPGDSEADVEKRNSAFLALMKMKGEPGFENLDMENLTGKFSPKDLVSFAKMANEAGVFDSYGGGGDITDNKIGPRVTDPFKPAVPMD